jgi:hypothetical protein
MCGCIDEVSRSGWAGGLCNVHVSVNVEIYKVNSMVRREWDGEIWGERMLDICFSVARFRCVVKVGIRHKHARARAGWMRKADERGV